MTQKSNKKRRKYIIWGAIGLVALLVILKSAGVIGKDNTLKASVEKATNRDITETISASGKIKPVREVKLSPDVSGEIVELLVKEGDRVKKGDILARIKTDLYKASYEQSLATVNSQKANQANTEARLVQAEAQMANAEASFNRSKKLFDKGAISESEFETAETQFRVAKADFEAAKQSVKGAKYNVASVVASMNESFNNLNRTTIIAPVDGIISKLNVEVGERVAGASQFSPGTEILRIADLTEMEINVTVNENEVVKIQNGDTSLIEVDAYPKRKFKGIVTEIASSASSTTSLTNDQVSNYEVTVRIIPDSYKDLIPKDKPDYSPFKPGMSASVEIITNTARNVLSVPIQAVTTRIDSTADEKKKADEAQQEYVFIVENGKAKKMPVKTGIQDNTYIQITEGLKKDQEVLSAPYSLISKILSGGEKIKIVPKKELFEK